MLVLAAVIIAAVSLVVSHILVRDLAIEERNRMEVWAEAMRSLSTAEENTDLNLVLKVINENNTIPVIVTDEQGNVQTFRNVEIVADNHDDSMAVAARKAADMRASGRQQNAESFIYRRVSGGKGRNQIDPSDGAVLLGTFFHLLSAFFGKWLPKGVRFDTIYTEECIRLPDGRRIVTRGILWNRSTNAFC